MDKKELIIEVLEGLSDSELLSIHNVYINDANMFDDAICTFDDLDMIAEGQDAYWLLCRAFYGDFNPTADYFKFNGYGNFQSIQSYELFDHIGIEEVAEYCADNNKSLYNDDIQEILNSEDEEMEVQNHETDRYQKQ